MAEQPLNVHIHPIALLLGPVEPGAAALALQTSTRLTLAAARIQASRVLTQGRRVRVLTQTPTLTGETSA